jgi:hypothetical protein
MDEILERCVPNTDLVFPLLCRLATRCEAAQGYVTGSSPQRNHQAMVSSRSCYSAHSWVHDSMRKQHDMIKPWAMIRGLPHVDLAEPAVLYKPKL